MVEPEDTLSPEDLMLAASLEARRPAPTPVFRGTLARRLTRQDPGYGHRPARLLTHAGVLAGAIGPDVVRLVTHHDVDDAGLARAVAALAGAPD